MNSDFVINTLCLHCMHILQLQKVESTKQLEFKFVIVMGRTNVGTLTPHSAIQNPTSTSKVVRFPVIPVKNDNLIGPGAS